MTKYEKHLKICEKLNEIYVNKNHDYGNSFWETFRKPGIIEFDEERKRVK